MQHPIIQPGERFKNGRIQEIVDTFRRDGFVHVPNVLEPDEVAALIETTDRLMDDPALVARECPERHEQRYVQMHVDDRGETPFILRNTLELDPIFPAMLVREPILGLAEAIVGAPARFCGQNVLRNQPSVAIERWHVDGAVHFPVSDDVSRHDPRTPPPVLWITVQIALTDIDTLVHGPTQYVPGSQLSGKHPSDPLTPTFEGRTPVSVLCKAGDIYIQDPQCWHRGAPNASDRVRYLMQNQYCVDWAYRRFGWMNRVPVEESVRADADARLLTVLGERVI